MSDETAVSSGVALIVHYTEINKQPTDDEQGFSSEDLVQHLRELDAPFEHLMTLYVPFLIGRDFH